MKKISVILACAAVLCSLASCDKPENKGGKKEKSATLTITAKGNTWAATDSLAVFEYADGEMSEMLVSAPLSESGTFTVTLPKDATAETWRYLTVYPVSAASPFNGKVVAGIPAAQTFSAKTFDPAAEMFWAASETCTERPSELSMTNARLGSTIKLTLTGLGTSEIVKSVTFASTTADLAGDVMIDPENGIGEVINGSKSVVLTPETSASRAGVAWGRFLSGTINDYSITVETDVTTYREYFATPLVLNEGKTVTMTFDVTGKQEKETIRIFLIGNSFTQDACHRLPGLLGGLDIKNVEVTQCYYGGRTVPEYNSGWTSSSDYTKHTALPGETVMTNTSGANLSKVAASQSWDIVCIQEHTGNYLAWTWNETEKTQISELMEKVAATQSKRPKFYYILSQTYYDMEKIGSGSRAYETWSNQAGMYDVTTAFARKVMEELSFDGIIATGTCLQNLRQTSLCNTMCLTRDGYHMDYGISRYAAACTCYQVMLYPIFGKDLATNTFRISELNTSSGTYTTPVTDSNYMIAVQAAKDAAINPYEVTYQTLSPGEGGQAGAGLGKNDFGEL